MCHLHRVAGISRREPTYHADEVLYAEVVDGAARHACEDRGAAVVSHQVEAAELIFRASSRGADLARDRGGLLRMGGRRVEGCEDGEGRGGEQGASMDGSGLDGFDRSKTYRRRGGA